MRFHRLGHSIAVVFDLVPVRIGEIDGALAAPSFDGDVVLLEFSFQALERRRADFESDVLQALVARRPLAAADEIQ